MPTIPLTELKRGDFIVIEQEKTTNLVGLVEEVILDYNSLNGKKINDVTCFEIYYDGDHQVVFKKHFRSYFEVVYIDSLENLLKNTFFNDMKVYQDLISGKLAKEQFLTHQSAAVRELVKNINFKN